MAVAVSLFLHFALNYIFNNQADNPTTTTLSINNGCQVTTIRATARVKVEVQTPMPSEYLNWMNIAVSPS